MVMHPGELSKSYPMNSNITGIRSFAKPLHPCALDESSVSIVRVNYDKQIMSVI